MGPRRSSTAFVARYDLKGNQVWFKQFLRQMPASGPIYSDLYGPLLALDAQGNIMAVSMGGPKGTMMWHLKAEDGSVL
jgi:hypothetical protein